MINFGSDIPSPDHNRPFESQTEELANGLEEEERWDSPGVEHESRMDFDVSLSRSLSPMSRVLVGDMIAMVVDSPSRGEQEAEIPNHMTDGASPTRPESSPPPNEVPLYEPLPTSPAVLNPLLHEKRVVDGIVQLGPEKLGIR